MNITTSNIVNDAEGQSEGNFSSNAKKDLNLYVFNLYVFNLYVFNLYVFNLYVCIWKLLSHY